MKQKRIAAITIAISVLLTACATGTSSDGASAVPKVRITGDSIGSLFNKRIFFIDSDGNEKRDNYFVLRADGNAEGAWNGKPLLATWEMQDDYWCRVMVEFHNAERIGSEDCQLWEQAGDVIHVARDRGKGHSWKQGIGEEAVQ